MKKRYRDDNSLKVRDSEQVGLTEGNILSHWHTIGKEHNVIA